MEPIRQYIKEHEVTFPVVLGDGTVAINYLGISPARPQFHVPTFFFVGSDGQIVEERDPDHAGNEEWFANLETNLEATIRRLLPPEPPASNKGKKAPARSAAKKQRSSGL